MFCCFIFRDWECKPSVLVSVGPLLQFADKEKIDTLCDVSKLDMIT